MSWLERMSASPRAQITATALVSGSIVAAGILGYQTLRRAERLEDLKASIPPIDERHHAEKLTDFGAAAPRPTISSKEEERAAALAERAQRGDYDDDLILEQLARNRVFLGDEGLQKLRDSFIIVVGVGGVGSHCVSALARSGASRLRIIDFDQVSLSSLNRHAVATLADVGTPKVHCLQRRLQAVVPWTNFDCRNQLFSAADAASLLAPAPTGQKPDFVVDAIDNIDSKVALLAYCKKNDIKVISSMGAGCKSDPTRIMVGDISTSTDDPLSRATRRKLRARPHDIASGIPVVFSTEKTGPGKAQLLPLPEEEFLKGKVGELAPAQDFRVRILPVLGTMPAVFGYAVANYVILDLAGYPITYAEGKGRDKMYDQILAKIQGDEEKLARQTMPRSADGTLFDSRGLRIPITAADVGYLVEEVFRGRSVVSGVPTRLVLVRWEDSQGETVDVSVPGQKISRVRLQDLVCMTKEESLAHRQDGASLVSLYDKEILERVEKLFAEEQHYARYR